MRGPLGALIVLGALLRFGTLGVQHLWLDEQATAAIVAQPFGEVLTTVRLLESSPPLFYVLAWAWGQLLGSSEVAVRALPALLGTLTIPLMHAAGTAIAGRRTGLAAAALTAVAPPLLWYSHEHRVYALLLPLAAAATWCWARTLHGDARWAPWGWAAAAACAFATHYFAVFLILPQALWLAWAGRPRRAVAGAVALVGVAGLAVTPLALAQRRVNAEWVGGQPLGARAQEVGEVFLAGTGLMPGWASWALGVLVLCAVGLLALAPEARRRALPPAVLAASAVLVPAALAVAGLDYVLARNLVAALVPALLVLAVALAAPAPAQAGRVVGGALLLAMLGASLAVPLHRGLQREALTAAMLGPGVDVERQRLRSVVVFARPGRGPVRARCAEGFQAVRAEAALLGRSARQPVAARLDGPAGFVATPPAEAPADTRVVLFGSCAAPRAG